MKRKNWLAVLAASSLTLSMVLGLGGCSGENSAAGASSSGTAVSETKEGEVIELTFSEQDDPQSADPTWAKIIAAFEAENPGIKVKSEHKETEGQRTDWNNSVLAGKGADLISSPPDNIPLFAEAKTAMELTGVIDESTFAMLDSNAVNNYKYKDKVYAIPYKVGNCLVLVYNKDLMPEPPKTLDELVQKAKELTKAPNQYGLVYDMVEPYFVSPFFLGNGGKIFDENGGLLVNSDAAKKAFQLIYDWKFTDKITPAEGNTDVANALFLEGKAAMSINGPWFFNQAKDAGINYGIAVLPEAVPFADAKVLMVNPNVKDPAKLAAINKFLAYINSKDNQLLLAQVSTEIPTNLEAKKDPYVTENEELKGVAEAVAAGIPQPSRPEMRQVWDTWRTVQAQVLSGKLEPEEAPAVWESECKKQIEATMAQQ